VKYLSVFSTDADALLAFDDIFLGNNWFDLDCTYSKGVFYENIKQPRLKSDLTPLCEDVIQDDSQMLDSIENSTLKSIVFDPPFLFRNRKSDNNDKMSQRFTYFKSFEELKNMYTNSIDCFYQKLATGGYVFFKCQDMTDGKFYCTHNEVINYATSHGFILKDIAIKVSKSKLQRDAVQQNCVAKVHSYWLVLQKKKHPAELQFRQGTLEKLYKPIIGEKRRIVKCE
jgi:hypothetical protein